MHYPMDERSRFDDFWEQIDQYNAPKLAEHFSQIAPRIFPALIHHFMQQEEVSIGNGFHGPVSWAIVHYNWYDSDKVLEFRLENKGRYSLYFHYWDDEGLLKELDYFLNDEELKVAPEGLLLLMKETVTTGQGRVANKHLLQHETKL